MITNVLSIFKYYKSKKYNSVILNYDPCSEDLFKWYQQLVSESLGKNSKGIIPIISSMPKDNHSLLQLYLSGFKPNFYTFYIVEENNTSYLNSKLIFDKFNFLKQNDVYRVLNSREKLQKIYYLKNIPYRSFHIKTGMRKLWRIFSFFYFRGNFIISFIKS